MYKKYVLGFLEVICGCMFAGKTQELIRVLTTLKYTNQKIIVFKHSLDKRYSKEDEISSHFGHKLKAIPIKNPEDVFKYDVNSYDIIAFDEIQFFDASILEIIKNLINKNKRVIAVGLDLDFRGEPFGSMPELLAMAEFVNKLSAICQVCGAAATRTQRIVNNKPAKYNESIISIGAIEKYEARCREHHKVFK